MGGGGGGTGKGDTRWGDREDRWVGDRWEGR